MEFIGQDLILNKINTLTFKNCPQSLMLVGPMGCGKHTVANFISDKLKLKLIPIEDQLNINTFDTIRLCPNSAIYTIESNKITTKEESSILKFLEEPPENSKILIYCTNKNKVLPTILNRCVQWDFLPYTKEQLSLFTSDKICLELAKTPGQCLEYSAQDLIGMLDFSNLILDKVKDANFSNILTIPNKIDFDNNSVNYPIDIFLKVLCYSAESKYCANQITIEEVDLVRNLVNDSTITNINKKHLFEHFLSELKLLSIVKGGA